MCIAECMNEVTALETGHLCHHLQQQGITGDVKRYTQEDIGAALIELQTEFTVRYIELEQAMTRR